MVRVQNLVSLLILVQFAGSGVAADPTSARINRIETGLRPAIVLGEVSAEQLDLEDRMRFYKTPAVSIAVIDNGIVALARGWGVHEAGTTKNITTDTIFQAASISKPVAALVALRLIEQGQLELDEDVNRKLRSWKLPESKFTADKKVSLRLLLSHRAGLTDNAGMRNSPVNQPPPTLREILETGKWTPAPIRVGIEPGTRFIYSGGGYCLMEQLLEDVSGKSFPSLARELVLEPLHMTNSSYEQVSFPESASRIAIGHGMHGRKLTQNWNVYAATSAAGLWTTPSDLARFAIELQKSKTSGSSTILSRVLMTEMLSTQGSEDDRDSKTIAQTEAIPEQPHPSWGLGVGLIGRPPTRFFHSGINPGYQCEMQVYLEGGKGAVIMTNGDQGWRLIREILWSIAREYEWSGYDYHPEIKKTIPLSQDELERFVGQYRISYTRPTQRTLSITRDGDHLFAQISDNAYTVRVYPESADKCFTIEDAMTLRFVKDPGGIFTDIASDLGWRAKREAK